MTVQNHNQAVTNERPAVTVQDPISTGATDRREEAVRLITEHAKAFYKARRYKAELYEKALRMEPHTAERLAIHNRGDWQAEKEGMHLASYRTICDYSERTGILTGDEVNEATRQGKIMAEVNGWEMTIR